MCPSKPVTVDQRLSDYHYLENCINNKDTVIIIIIIIASIVRGNWIYPIVQLSKVDLSNSRLGGVAKDAI